MTRARVAGFEHSGIISNAEVEEFLHQLPDNHVSNPLKAVIYVDKVVKVDQDDPRLRPLLVVGECEIHVVAETRDVIIATIRIYRHHI